jgi:peptide deformylase
MTLHVQTGTTNEILRTASKPVSAFTSELKSFALDMIKTMEAENGVGLAAPQVGRNIRMVICKLNPGEDNEVIIPMINPVVMQASLDQEEGEEGCLSLPGTWGQVLRSSEIVLRYKNLKGQEQTLVLDHLNARIVQHEIDHLDGILFVDRATQIEEKKGRKKKDGVQI